MATLSALSTELLARLGFAAVAASSGPTTTNTYSIISRSQNWLYWAYNWENLRTLATIASVSSQAAYSFPSALEQRKLIDVASVKAGVATQLREGVPPDIKSGTTTPGPTLRYWLSSGQISFWPAPDSTLYSFVLDGYKSLGPFAVGTDTSTIDDEAIMELSIATAKYHYGQADGPMYVQLVNSLIGKLNDSNEASGRQEFLITPPAALSQTPVPPERQESSI